MIHIKLLLLAIFAISSNSIFASDSSKKPQMKLLGVFDAGQPGVSIVKIYDASDDVVCYVLTPDVTARKQLPDGKFSYEGNTIGSISCLKVKVPVIQLNPQQNR